ncbi:MAG TPA: DUF4349 domain-containing protein [Dehalococcoidia bacterium]|nr:DUF4349 domain-containing protein [Dehalococcoidia bacterium]
MRNQKMLGGGLLAAFALMAAVACSSRDEAQTSGEVDSVAPAETVARSAGAPSTSDALVPPSKAAAVAEAGSSTAASAAVDVLGRKIIRNGTLALQVESVTGTYEQVGAVAARLGGYVAEGSYSGAGDARTGRLVIRVPADNYDRAIAELQGLAKTVTSASSSSQDVTGEVSDLDAGLRNLRAVEAQYVAFLTQARTIPDLLQVQERLQSVRGDIERTEARLALLNRLSDLATITVQLAPIPVVMEVQHHKASPAGAAAEAWDASLETLRQVAVVGVAVVVYSWWLMPGIAAAAYLGLRHMRGRRVLTGAAS